MYPGGLVQGTLNEAQQKEKNNAIDWCRFPVNYLSGYWAYGKRTQSFDFWHWGQGLMTCGKLQMTPRNNFHSQPKPYFTKFGHGPGSEKRFPYWVDAQTPGRPGLERPCRRERDWYWTLNQASMRLVRTGETQVTVELGTSQPFFRRFVGRVDDGEPTVFASPFVWNLKPGENRLEVNCEDDFGNAGIPSSIALTLGAGS
jgi:hypothetical protein